MNPSAENHSPNTDADWCPRGMKHDGPSVAQGSRDASLLDTALTQLREAWQARANAALDTPPNMVSSAPKCPTMMNLSPNQGSFDHRPPSGCRCTAMLTAGLEHGVPVWL